VARVPPGALDDHRLRHVHGPGGTGARQRVLLRAARAGPGLSSDGVEYTYGETRARVLELRERYAAAGYGHGHGHRVALLLENRLAHEAVAQVAVLAVPDEVREEEVMACVVPLPGVTADAALADRLVDWCLERRAYFKAPGWLLFLDRLPTTGTQKVQKAQIFPRGEDPRRREGVIDRRQRKRRG